MEQDKLVDSIAMSDEDAGSAHPNVILHLDIDYFYAQVEEILNPALKCIPFGVKQGMNIVTCNYLARARGVGKWRPLKECLEKCPELTTVCGEDLTNYKLYSKLISDMLLQIFGSTERIGLDEHYIDVTKEIEKELLRDKLLSNNTKKNCHQHNFEGCVYPDEQTFDNCKCGCKKRLIIGTEIAQRVRKKLFDELKITCSIGIAHNKILAKLGGQKNKPNNQTTVAPTSAQTFMKELINLRCITGIGEKTKAKIEQLNINTIEDLQQSNLSLLQKKLGNELAVRLRDLSMGIDTSDYKPSGKQNKTVGLEDSFSPFRPIRSDAEEKFKVLLSRLMISIQDQGRVPQSIKVTVRKYDPVKKSSIRETKQCTLATSLFKVIEGKIHLAEGAEQKIIKNVLILFDRMVDLKLQFNITLLGLCFSKFQEEKRQGQGSIANYLLKKQLKTFEVQSITNLSNETNGSCYDSFRSKTASPSSSLMDFETISNNSLDFSGSEESEKEPSPKKRKKINLLLVARNRYSSNDDVAASPSKLNVSDLHLNVFESTNSIISPFCSESIACSSTSHRNSEIPQKKIDPAVWQELPLDVQRELMVNWKTTGTPSTSKTSTVSTTSISKSKLSSTKKSSNNNNTLHKYFIQNS